MREGRGRSTTASTTVQGWAEGQRRELMGGDEGGLRRG